MKVLFDIRDYLPAGTNVRDDGSLSEDDVSHESVLHEKFLVDEGLDLLAAFRRINDKTLRAKVIRLIRSLADGGAVPACLDP